MSLILAPSILAADFLQLDRELAQLTPTDTPWLHLDIMDGHFVPNLSFGMPIIEAIHKKFPAFKLDAHLMVTNPAFYLEALADKTKYHISHLTFHYEAIAGITYQDQDYGGRLAQITRDQQKAYAENAEKLIMAAKSIYPSVGIALRPATPLDVLSDRLLTLVDLVLLMTVEPGFAGQKFIPQVLPKLQQLASRRQELSATWQIQVDGGVNLTTIKQLGAANHLVVGAALFKNPPYNSTLQQLAKNYATDHS